MEVWTLLFYVEFCKLDTQLEILKADIVQVSN